MIDPASIPQHVVDAAWGSWVEAWTTMGGSEAQRYAIAAALDALMDDEQVTVPDPDHNVRHDLMLDVCPSDVLAAVLDRAKES